MRFAKWCIAGFLAATGGLAADREPARIISASPNITEILYGVGAFDHVVAVSDYCTFPPQVNTLPRIGRWLNSNLEAIVSLRPDLVLYSDFQGPSLKDKLDRLGILSAGIPSRTLADVFAAMDTIGKAVHHESQAAALAARVHARIEAVRNRTHGLARRNVLFVVDRSPGTLRDIYAATPGSFLAELMEVAGGHCVGNATPDGYTKLSKEAILALNPDLVIDMVHGSKGVLAENPAGVWGDLPELRAVRERRVYPVRNDFLPHGSQFVADTAELLVSVVHPELSKEKVR